MRLRMKWIVLTLVILAAVFGVYWWFTSLPSAKQLDTADSFFSDEAPVKLVASDVSYGQENRQQLNVWKPDVAPGSDAKLPVLVFYYGGSWNSGDRNHYAFAARAYAARGFLVVLPDYRLYPETRFPSMLEDTAASIAWTHANIGKYGGDADNIFIAGHSAGAYNVVMTALDRQYLGRLGLDSSIIKGVVGLAGAYDFYPFSSDAAKASFGEAESPEGTQPITYARKDAPPLWLATGDADKVVEPRNSEALAAKVTQLGGQAELKIYPGIDHYEIIMAVSRPFRSKASVIDDSVAFMKAQIQ